MVNYTLEKLDGLFRRPFFERVIIYCFLSELIVKIIFELGLGQWWFGLSPVKQIVLYAIFAIDYAVNFRKIVAIRFWGNPIFYFMLIVFIMVAQGTFVGIYNHNVPFEIFNDSVPLLLLAMNSLRMQSPAELQSPIDFPFLLRFCSFMSLSICCLGFLAKSMGLPSTAAISGVISGVYYALFVAALLTGYKLRLLYWVCFFTVAAFSADDFNRTTLAFFMFAGLVLFLKYSVFSPVRAMLLIIIMTLLGFALWNFLPDDSKTKQRFTDLAQLSSQSRTGSVGERMSEWVSIQAKVEQSGTTARWIGLGHGALYDVRYTFHVIRDYGFAHFAWALFYFRYGLSGYCYLALLTIMLIWQTLRCWSFNSSSKMTISLLSLMSILYLATYVNFVILCMGLQFLLFEKSKVVNKTVNNLPNNSVGSKL
jgi:hypothetical protein